MTSGEDPGGLAAWVFDSVSFWGGEPEEVLPTRVRVTALLTRAADGWRVAAAYWSLPFVTQAEQDAVKHAGQLDAGMAIPESQGASAAPFAAALFQALDEPRLLPALYSTSQDHATIGSVVDEVSLGATGSSLAGVCRVRLVVHSQGVGARSSDDPRPGMARCEHRHRTTADALPLLLHMAA